MKFLSALAADGTIHDVEEIIGGNLRDVYDPMKEHVAESMSKQGEVLANIQVSNPPHKHARTHTQHARTHARNTIQACTHYMVFRDRS